MSRYRNDGSYGFRCQKIGWGGYLISWTWDKYYSDSRLRYPRRGSRITDENGARRFCKKHNILFPEEERKG